MNETWVKSQVENHSSVFSQVMAEYIEHTQCLTATLFEKYDFLASFLY
jgi:hypothetical protein